MALRRLIGWNSPSHVPLIHALLKKNPDADQAAIAKSLAEVRRQDAEAIRKQEEQLRRIEDALKRLKVQTILYSDESPMALISNRVYRTGDHLGIFVISKIHRDSLVLKVGDETFVKNLD